jgi:hypothetical protein
VYVTSRATTGKIGVVSIEFGTIRIRLCKNSNILMTSNDFMDKISCANFTTHAVYFRIVFLVAVIEKWVFRSRCSLGQLPSESTITIV